MNRPPVTKPKRVLNLLRLRNCQSSKNNVTSLDTGDCRESDVREKVAAVNISFAPSAKLRLRRRCTRSNSSQHKPPAQNKAKIFMVTLHVCASTRWAFARTQFATEQNNLHVAEDFRKIPQPALIRGLPETFLLVNGNQMTWSIIWKSFKRLIA